MDILNLRVAHHERAIASRKSGLHLSWKCGRCFWMAEERELGEKLIPWTLYTLLVSWVRGACMSAQQMDM
eukprot:1146560-Pelagomonas_calceolata.AAC.1